MLAAAATGGAEIVSPVGLALMGALGSTAKADGVYALVRMGVIGYASLNCGGVLAESGPSIGGTSVMPDTLPDGGGACTRL